MGNPTSYLGKTLSWQGKQLTSYTDGSTNISYSYNEDGLRLRKVVDGTDTEYYYNGSVLMYMVTGTGSNKITQRFAYDASGSVVSVSYKEGSGTSYIYYYVRNAQGDVVRLIDSSGSVVVKYMYDSWGKPVFTTGDLASTVGANQPFRYRGYFYDTETGWYYLQSRYYDPNTCRFISADVLLSTGQGVLGNNCFAYCLNTPINGLDDDGHALRPFSVMTADSGGGNSLNYASYVIPCRNNNRKQSIEKLFSFMTSDEKTVISRGKRGCKFTLYKGTLIIYFNPNNGRIKESFTPGPCILLANDANLDPNTIKHEYGHSRQFRILGIRYFKKIGGFSLVGFALAKKNPIIYNYYYSQPCERSAELLGNVDRKGEETYLEGSDIASILHLLLP